MKENAQRNIKWSRDELILALDTYFCIKPKAPDPGLLEITSLSTFLKNIGHMDGHGVAQNFRSPASVVMKLMNFRSFDPDYQGKGLEAAGKTDQLVWDEFSEAKTLLKSLAAAIHAGYQATLSQGLQNHIDGDFVEAPEGRILTYIHFSRERNPQLTRVKKRKVLKETGALCCEICSFDFHKKYGERGRGYIECHHVKPLYMSAPGTLTQVDDLALVCSNCHRMLHGMRPWPSMEQLKSELLNLKTPH